MREEEQTLAWCLCETAHQFGAARGQWAAAVPWPLCSWQEAPLWPLGRPQGQWVAEAPRKISRSSVAGSMAGGSTFVSWITGQAPVNSGGDLCLALVCVEVPAEDSGGSLGPPLSY